MNWWEWLFVGTANGFTYFLLAYLYDRHAKKTLRELKGAIEEVRSEVDRIKASNPDLASLAEADKPTTYADILRPK